VSSNTVWGDPKDPAGALRVLRRAVELGVDFIDTADSCGPFVAEQSACSSSTASTRRCRSPTRPAS
jgi:aryl-alcohol dehydrogenase-like predicted oxidoreductase